jgi:hypothetical protein
MPVMTRAAKSAAQYALEQVYLHKIYKRIIMPAKDKTFQCVDVQILPHGSVRLRMQQIDNPENISIVTVGYLDKAYELSSIATGNPYCVLIS